MKHFKNSSSYIFAIELLYSFHTAFLGFNHNLFSFYFF